MCVTRAELVDSYFITARMRRSISQQNSWIVMNMTSAQHSVSVVPESHHNWEQVNSMHA